MQTSNKNYFRKWCGNAIHLTLLLPGSDKRTQEVADSKNPVKFPFELGPEITE